MKTTYLSNTDSRRLVLFMAGWGMDDAPFRALRRPGYDVVAVWDYRRSGADWSFADSYDEICLFAWSLGVAAAGRFIPESVKAKITRRVAINGTDTPADDLRGIPVAIFCGTLAGLDERSLAKFRLRMCGSRQAYDAFCTHAPARALDDLREELEVFLGEEFSRPSGFRWDTAVIGSRDAIFPPANQRRAWKGMAVDEKDASHIVDFQSIIDRYAIDKDMMGERFESGRRAYDGNAEAQRNVVEHICRMLDSRPVGRDAAVLEIGSGSGLLSRELAARFDDLELWDIAGDSPLPSVRFRRVDAELEIGRVPDATFDLIASASTVQWFNSPRRFLAACARVLRPGGLLIFSTFLPGNLAEVESATGRSLPLQNMEQWRSMVPEGTEIIGEEAYEFRLCFGSPLEVFRHLQATGVNSLSREASLFRALKAYPVGDDGRCSLTYRPVIFLLKKL